MKVVVHDASILIDLLHTQTVDAWFATGVDTWTTNLIYPAEISDLGQRAIIDPYVEANELRIYDLSSADIEGLFELRNRMNKGLSLADFSTLQATQNLGEDVFLATGDLTLRNAAQKTNVNVCGLLGLFDIMVSSNGARGGTLPALVAADRLRRFLNQPECRIPRKDCLDRIRRWSHH